MDKLLPYVSEEIQSIIAVMLIVVSQFMPPVQQLFRRRKQLEKSQTNIDFERLMTDDLFSKSAFYLKKIESFKFFSDINSFLFRSFLQCKVKKVNTVMLKWLNDNKTHIEKYTVAQLHTIFQTLVETMVESYEKAFFNLLVDKFQHVQAAKELYELIVPEFREFHRKNIETLSGQIALIPNSLFLDDNYERISAFLTNLHWALKAGIFDAERMFAAKNGQAQKILDQYGLKL